MNYMSLARLRDSFGLALLSILFVASVYRAWSLSISMDEAHTYLSFVAPPLTQILTTYSPNHHVLFSLLAKASIQTFGVSELSLRLPALLGCLLFFSATWGVGRVLFEDRSTMLLSLCLVTLNPLTFDYMSQARGYSLSLGFYLFGVLSLIRFPLTESSNRKSSRLVLAGLLLGLAVAANLAFGIPVLALNLLFGAALAARSSALKALSWLFCSESIAFCAIAGSPLLHADRGEFIGGFASVFDTLSNFSIACLIHDWDGNGVWTKPINVWTSYFLYPAFRIVVLIVLGTVTCLLAGYLWRRLKPRPPRWTQSGHERLLAFLFRGQSYSQRGDIICGPLRGRRAVPICSNGHLLLALAGIHYVPSDRAIPYWKDGSEAILHSASPVFSYNRDPVRAAIRHGSLWMAGI
jgi:4-amino-4-deoxy-L-arabinose transferase-like glycosyltransferase